MTDFVIIAAAAAMLAGPMPAPGAPAASPGAASPSLAAPTVGFRTYPDAASCEQAAAALVAPAGSRFVCIPVQPMVGEMASAH